VASLHVASLCGHVKSFCDMSQLSQVLYCWRFSMGREMGDSHTHTILRFTDHRGTTLSHRRTLAARRSLTISVSSEIATL